MTIPTYDLLMLPVLRHCAETTWQMRDLIRRIADDLGLSEEERAAQIPSGSTTIIASRVHWAKTYLKQAGLLEQPKRGVVQITQRGRDVLASNPTKIDTGLLEIYPEFQSFVRRTKSTSGPATEDLTMVGPAPESSSIQPSETPEEQITTASKTLNEALRDALLARILEASPTFFEQLIIDLLLRMGYGGSSADAGEHLGRTGDGGVDGVIREDHLGLDRVYLQAKRFQPGNTVGSEMVQAFIGALIGKGAQKGVLITTSTFSKAALNVATQTGSLRLVLLDGYALTNLMVRFNVGVRISQTIDIKRVDLDYFEDSEPE